MTQFSTLDAEENVVFLEPGRPFVTHWLIVRDAAEAEARGRAVGQRAPAELSHPWNALDRYDAETLARYLITPVTPSLTEQKAALRVAVDAAYDARRTSPMPWDFGEMAALTDLGESAGAAGPQTLQMRETPRDDLKNWLAVATGASAAAAAGAPGTIMPIKTTANVWVQTTAADLVQVLIAGDGTQLSALQRGTAMLARYGVLKATVAACETAEDLAAVEAEIEAGWPA